MRALIIGGPLEFLGHEVVATFHSVLELDTRFVNIYSTEPPKFDNKGTGPYKFQEQHLSDISPSVEIRAEDSIEKGILEYNKSHVMVTARNGAYREALPTDKHPEVFLVIRVDKRKLNKGPT